LAERDGFWCVIPARGGDDEIEYFLAALLDGFFTGDDRPAVVVDEVWHPLGERGVRGKFERWADRIASGGAQTGGEENHRASRASERRGGLDIVPRRAAQREATALADGFGVVGDIHDGRVATFLCGSGGLNRIGDQAIANVSRARIGVEAAAAGLRCAFVGPHQAHKLVCQLGGYAAVTQALLYAAELGELAEHGRSAECSQQVGGMADGWIRGDTAEAITAPAFHGHDEIAERARFAGLLVSRGDSKEGVTDGTLHHVTF